MATCSLTTASKEIVGFYRSPHIVINAVMAIGCILTTLLSGCVHNTSIPYRSFELIEIIALDPETTADDAPSKGESAAKGAAAGAVGGLTVSLFASLACGPFFPACFAATAPVTIGATTLVGAGMGMSGISAENAEKATPYLESLQATHNMSKELAAVLSEQLHMSSLVPTGVADARLSLDVNSFQLVKRFGQKLAFSLAVTTEYEWSLNGPSPQHSSRIFWCETPLRPIDEWADDGGATLEQKLNYCIENIAIQINKVLTEPPPSSVDGFSETVE